MVASSTPYPPAADGQVLASSISPKVYPALSPFPVVRLRGAADGDGVLITLLRVQAPAGSRVSVHCFGRACPTRRTSETAVASAVRVRAFERRLRAGTSLKIYVTKPGFTGKYTRFTIQRDKPPLRTDRCARQVAAPPVACPVN